MGIVLLLEFRLAKNFIGFVNFFEVRLVPTGFVRMVLFGQEIELLLYFLVSGALRQSQNLVVILAKIYKGIVGAVEVDDLCRRSIEGSFLQGLVENTCQVALQLRAPGEHC